jgi:phosphate transport system protein
MVESRLHFQDELKALERQTLEGLDMVSEAMEQTLSALRGHDLALADQVVAGDDRIDGRYLEVHQGILSLIARQAPVATDLRLIAALLDVIRDVERMGDQCVNIAKAIALAGDPPAEDGGMLAAVVEMGECALALVPEAASAFAERDVRRAEQLVSRDDAVDHLNRQTFSLALHLAGDAQALEWAMRMVQVARAIERIGDLAVDIGEQSAFVATGHFREFTDASHPELRTASAPGTGGAGEAVG